MVLVPIFASAQTEFVTNGSFETGDFEGWTVLRLPDSAGDWSVYTGGDFFSLPPPPVGNFAAATFQGFSSSQVLLQDITIPNGAEVACSVVVYYRTSAEDFVIGPGLVFDLGPNQQARIDIISTDADPFTVSSGLLLNVFQTLPGDPLTLGYTPVDFDLSQFAGQSVTFRAAQVNSGSQFNFAIDDVSCIAPASPIPTLGEWGMMAMAGALGIAGLLYARRRRSEAA